MFTAKTNYARIAFETILFYVSTGQIKKTDESKISPDLKLKTACVVSIYDTENNLKGCMGNIFPQKPSLYQEIIENSIAAAVKDKKFKPITNTDLNKIKVTVDVLSMPQKVENFEELKPHKHGLYVKDNDGNNGFIMPGTKRIKTVEQLIDGAKKAVGIQAKKNKDLEFLFFKSARYE